MKRREFIKYGACGLTLIALGGCKKDSSSPKPGGGNGENNLPTPPPQPLTVNLSMEDALVEMVDTTQVYFWLFKLQGALQPSIPGPVIVAFTGDNLSINVTNNLDEVHEFRIIAAGPNLTDLNTGPINPGQTATLNFIAPPGGTYMYLDPRNAPVNRVLGLHGAFIVLPAAARNATPGPGLIFGAPAITPYSTPTTQVQRLFNDLGNQPFFPGQSWVPVRPADQPIPEPLRMALEQRLLPAAELARLEALEPFLFRTRIWVFNSVDPTFNFIAQNGGNAEPGGGIDPAFFRANFLARYFLTNGKSGAFSSLEDTAPESVLAAFIGEPHVVRILNAGMEDFSPHLHANHFYVIAENNVVQENVTHPDSFTLRTVERDISFSQLQADPLGASSRLFLDGGSRVDWVVPYIRPPDIPGNPNTPLQDLIPQELAIVLEGVPQWPLMYPMHSHVEQDQTAAGGNYPQGLITHFLFLGELINGVEVPFPATPVPLNADGTPQRITVIPPSLKQG
jgi:FtsP/CotA-like multicopper oxidase with cupredoxin domain